MPTINKNKTKVSYKKNPADAIIRAIAAKQKLNEEELHAWDKLEKKKYNARKKLMRPLYLTLLELQHTKLKPDGTDTTKTLSSKIKHISETSFTLIDGAEKGFRLDAFAGDDCKAYFNLNYKSGFFAGGFISGAMATKLLIDYVAAELG